MFVALKAWLPPSFVIALVFLGAAAAAQPPSLKEPQITLLDGERVPVRSLSIEDGKVTGEGAPPDLTIDDLRQIELPRRPPAGGGEKPAVVVELSGGGRVPASGITIADEKAKIEWSLGQPLELPIDALRAIRFDLSATPAEFEAALAAPSADLDRLFIKLEEGKLESVAGLVLSLTPSELTFEIEGASRKLPREKLYGIVIAQPNVERGPPPATVELTGGTTLGGVIESLANGKLVLKIPGGGEAIVPWEAVARVVIRSSRVAYLSDMQPAAEEQQAIVTLPRPAQRDKSVTLKPLTLGGRVFEKGWGVHSRSSLTFRPDKSYDVLAATIGLDAGAGGKGDCIFTVLVDGQAIFSQRKKGTDPPEEIRVPVGDASEVTLLVEPGADLDLADHANWCEARFIKNKP